MDKLRNRIQEIRAELNELSDDVELPITAKELKKELELLEKEKTVYIRFEIACDGVPPYYETDTICPSTHQMGVCKIKYEHDENALHVWLRRPGLLIGKAGRTIDALKEHLECDIKIHEVKRLWDWE